MTSKQLEDERFFEAQRLAETGLGRCHGPCRTIRPLEDMISVSFRKTIATAICTLCLEHIDLNINMLPEGINVRLIKRSPIVLLGK